MLLFTRCKKKTACSKCNGYGLIECSECEEISRMHQFQPVDLGSPDCSKCNGFGYINCRNCGGSGEIS